MFIKTPKFWLEKNYISYLLLPFSLIYLVGFWLVSIFRATKAVSVTTICIGNINAGGAGKTPVAIAIGKILQELSLDFVYLSKGYLAQITDFALVEKNEHNADENLGLKYGDEPLLLSEIAPSFIGNNRFKAAEKICNLYQWKKLSAIIIDDGLQNNSLKKDLKILVIDGNIGFGNGFLIPAGPLRQTIKSGVNLADIIIIIDDFNQVIKNKITGLIDNLHQETAPLIIDANLIANNLDNFLNQKLVAFCGIGYPQKFFSFLKAKKLELIKTISFSDHKFYSCFELQKLEDIANKHQAKLITTKKDWVKFPKLWQERIAFLDTDINIKDYQILKQKIKSIIRK